MDVLILPLLATVPQLDSYTVVSSCANSSNPYSLPSTTTPITTSISISHPLAPRITPEAGQKIQCHEAQALVYVDDFIFLCGQSVVN
jgi:hypothetical protein